MDKQNITLSLPKEILHKVKLLAVRKHESVSGLLSQVLTDLVAADAAYSEARAKALKRLKTGHDLGTGGSLPCSREALHER